MSSNIPDFQSLMLPFLKVIADGRQRSIHDVYEELCNIFNLSDTDKELLLPSGNQAVMRNRVGWTRTYLKKAGLISSPQRTMVAITDEGKRVLGMNLERLDVKFLRQYPVFKDWHAATPKDSEEAEAEKTEIESNKTPEELLEYSYTRLRSELALEVLEKVKASTPAFFEILVVELLINMGYGGSRKDAGHVVGRSGDGGIDGQINEDKLGLDTVYVQAKKYEGAIPISHVRDFAGSLLAKKARKGVFITTSSFPSSAEEFVASIEPKIRLIDGKELADLMVQYNVGVAVKKTFDVKKLDTDYFEEI